jgi:hypothetical protein
VASGQPLVTSKKVAKGKFSVTAEDQAVNKNSLTHNYTVQ